MEPLFADPFANAGRVVLNFLAIAGGFLIGNVLTLLLCRLVAKMFLKRQLPQILERALRILGGIIVAILVAFLVFGDGGWGFGGSGGARPGGSGGDESQQKDEGKDKQAGKKTDPNTKDSEPILASGLTVTILRGANYPRTFLFEGETEGVDLAAAKDKLRKRHEDSKGRLKFVDLLVYQNSTAEGHPIVQEFEAFAYTLDLKTARKKLAQPLPE